MEDAGITITWWLALLSIHLVFKLQWKSGSKLGCTTFINMLN